MAGMAHPRPFRFGVSAISTGSAAEWRDLARRTEDLGFSTLLGADHFNDQIAPLPSLAMAAEATTTLRVGTLVLGSDFKHPVMLAKELATLDVLSEGRVEWGMGAGWLPSDYETTGIPMDPPGVRVSRFDEVITVMKHLFGDGPTTFSGEHFQITGLDGTPKPLQRPYPPLLIGGAGDRMLGIAARRATIVGVAPAISTAPVWGAGREMPAAAADRQLARVRAVAGERYEKLEISMVPTLLAVTDRPDEEIARISAAVKLPPEEVVASPYLIIGTEDGVVEGLEARRERWDVSYWTIPRMFMDAAAPIVARLAGR
jgi:probable F420-dependent oxidoreductase